MIVRLRHENKGKKPGISIIGFSIDIRNREANLVSEFWGQTSVEDTAVKQRTSDR